MGQLTDVKLICMDMDGTLFGSGEQIPEINLYALRRARERGIRLALVSGRNWRFLAQHANAIAPGIAIVSANGARIDEQPGGKCIFESSFTPAFANKVSRVLWDSGLNYEVYTDRCNYSFRSERVTPQHASSLKRYIQKGQVARLVLREGPEVSDIAGIYKFVAFCDEPEKIAALQKALDDKGIVHSSSSAQNVEVMPEGVGKGRAVALLARHFDIPIADTLAFGDYTNDIDMLKSAGHGIAMENAVPSLKAVAEALTGDNRSGGVGRFILEHVLEEPANA